MTINDAIKTVREGLKLGIVEVYILQALVEDGFSTKKAETIIRWAKISL